MKGVRAALAVLALLVVPAVASAQDQATLDAAAAARVVQAVERSGLIGTYAVHAGPRRIAAGSVGRAVDGQPGGFGYQALWPWGEIGRRIAATMVMQEIEAGRLSLDVPLTRYLPQARRGATLRGAIATPDPVLLVGVLERTTRRSFADLFAQRIAGPLGLTAHLVGTANGVDERGAGGLDEAERQAIARRPLTDRLEGSAVDLATVDRALLSGALLSNGARADLWRIAGARRRVALAGCAAMQEVVDQRGEVGRFAVRNMILPAEGVSVVLFTNRGAAGLGQEGASAIAGAAACP